MRIGVLPNGGCIRGRPLLQSSLVGSLLPRWLASQHCETGPAEMIFQKDRLATDGPGIDTDHFVCGINAGDADGGKLMPDRIVDA